MGKRVVVCVVVAVALVVLVGCGRPASGYLAQRGADLADCFEGRVGYGFPAYVGVKATDYLVAGLGMATSEKFGWAGRYRNIEGKEREEGIPLLFNRREVGEAEGGKEPAYTEETLSPFSTIREFHQKDAPRPPEGGRLAEQFWLSASLTAGPSVSLGFNLAEFADFLVGLTTLDLLGDDDWPPQAAPKAAKQ